MAFNVPNESKIELLTKSLESLNLEGYQHEINLKSSELRNDPDAIDRAKQAIAIIESAITVIQEELDNLN